MRTPELVTNTGPLIAIAAAVGSFDFLSNLYQEILVPLEVVHELEAGGEDCYELKAIQRCSVFRCAPQPANPPVLLRSQLDLGEASVIQNALIHGAATVAIDEKLGRRIARLHRLRVTGSIGILVKAAKAGLIPNLMDCFSRMNAKGIWLSESLTQQALDAVESE